MVTYKKAKWNSRTPKPRGLKAQADYTRKYSGLYRLPMYKQAQAMKVAKRWNQYAPGLSVQQRENRMVARLRRAGALRYGGKAPTAAEKRWLSPYLFDAGVRKEIRRNKRIAQKKWKRNKTSFGMPQHMRALKRRGHTKY